MMVFPDGSKERLHGHNFRVTVSVEIRSLKYEHMLDFGIIKRSVARVCDSWDERLLLARRNPHMRLLRTAEGEVEFSPCGARYVVPAAEAVLLEVDNISVEVLASEFTTQLLAEFGPEVRGMIAVIEVTIAESDGQGATCSTLLADT
jgi:6-pyruvoyltetrahydropterin/6-carboxytetrahydropterin synthase